MGKDVLEIIVGRIEKAKSFAVVVQETWREKMSITNQTLLPIFSILDLSSMESGRLWR